MTSPTLTLGAGLAGLAAWGILLGLGQRALRWGLVDHPGGRKRHVGAVPLVGGTALLAAWALGLLLAPWSGSGLVGGAWWAGGLVALYALGLWDDWGGKSMHPATKAAGTAVVITAWCVVAGAGPMEGLLAFFVLHSFNTSDNMNGLAAGLALIGGGALALAVGGQGLPGGLGAACTLGAGLAAFLLWNFPHGRVFLGDSGSLFLGGAFASAGLSSGDPGLLCFVAVPLGDLVGVSLRRLAEGRAPWRGDREHLSHRLARTLGAPRAVAALVGAQLLCAGLGFVLLGREGASWVAPVLVGLIAAATAGLPRAAPRFPVAERETASRSGRGTRSP